MRSVLLCLLLTCLIFACTKTDQNLSPAIDALSEKFDYSNLGNYKGVFTTLDSETRATVDVSITPDGAKATFETESGQIHEFYSMTEIVEGEQTEAIFQGNEGSFKFSVGADGSDVEITDVVYLDKPADILAKKNTAKAPSNPITGTYRCTNCGAGQTISHPVFTDNNVIQTFSFMIESGGTGAAAVTTQINYDGSSYTVGSGSEGTDGSVQASNITSADADPSGDNAVTISGSSTVIGSVNWEGVHSFGGANSELAGFWDFNYGGQTMRGQFSSSGADPTSVVITTVFDGPLTGGTPKGIELYAITDIPDLTIYGVGSANNGGGTDGEEFTLTSGLASAGDFIYVASESQEFNNFFGFMPNYTTGAMGINGDDAIELFKNSSVYDTFGEINMDGSGRPWDHLDGWAKRVNGTDPVGAAWDDTNWTYSGTNILDGETTNATATSPVPVGQYTH